MRNSWLSWEELGHWEVLTVSMEEETPEWNILMKIASSALFSGYLAQSDRLVSTWIRGA